MGGDLLMFDQKLYRINTEHAIKMLACNTWKGEEHFKKGFTMWADNKENASIRLISAGLIPEMDFTLDDIKEISEEDL